MARTARVPQKQSTRSATQSEGSSHTREPNQEATLAGTAHQIEHLGLPLADTMPSSHSSAETPVSQNTAVPPVQSAEGAIQGEVHRLAEAGTSGAGGPLPHLGTIQAAFGRHDVSSIRAHTDTAARDSATAMGATAYATGHNIAFAGSPELHTAAHEAAHVVQQRRGVSLKGGVGQAGDAYERHADEVADAVVAGKSAEALLDRSAQSAGAGASDSVQLKLKRSVMTDLRLRIAMEPSDWVAFRTSAIGEQTSIAQSVAEEHQAPENAAEGATAQVEAAASEGPTTDPTPQTASGTATESATATSTTAEGSPLGGATTDTPQTASGGAEPAGIAANDAGPMVELTPRQELVAHFAKVEAEFLKYTDSLREHEGGEESPEVAAASEKTRELKAKQLQLSAEAERVSTLSSEILDLRVQVAQLPTNTLSRAMKGAVLEKMYSDYESIKTQENALLGTIEAKQNLRAAARARVNDLRASITKLQQTIAIHLGYVIPQARESDENQHPAAVQLEQKLHDLLPYLLGGSGRPFPFSDAAPRDALIDFLRELENSTMFTLEAANQRELVEKACRAGAATQRSTGTTSQTEAAPAAAPPSMDTSASDEAIQSVLIQQEAFGWSSVVSDPVDELRSWALKTFSRAFSDMNSMR
ncbi:MAG TPA: hypothetical protein DFR83_06550 [Deltaproteobacteria bacterium]|nr:hypothetical protein [Deltaproteobacteria bacterium]